MIEDRIVGCILGTAVGDAIGLPYEGLSRQRAGKLLGAPDRHRFCFGRGMVSDDTEHTCMVAQALIDAKGNAGEFQRLLARRFRWWLLGAPAGVGLATLRATIRLWIGYSPERSGVRSAGNGPAMRAAILGVAIRDFDQLGEFVRVSTRLTHTDPKAELGALAVALAARLASFREKITPYEYLDYLTDLIGTEDSELISLIAQAADSVNAGKCTVAFAESLGLAKGVSGYVYHTVPVAIHAWLSHQHDCRTAIMAVVQCGGDADSTGAIVGGIVGAGVGRHGIPQEWLDGLIEWPRTVAWMEKLGKQLAKLNHERSKKIEVAFERPVPTHSDSQFDLEDFRKHLQAILKPSLLQRMFMLWPGVSKETRDRLKKLIYSEEAVKSVKQQISIIDAMTPEDRKHPQNINESSVRQIANDSGVRPSEVTYLLRQFEAMREMMYAMANPTKDEYAPRLPVFGVLVRNLFFLTVVLCHGLRRLAPPYAK